MITDSKTNFLYFSDLLPKKFPGDWFNIQKVLEEYSIEYGFLKSTRDIWCRDYMPIQVSKNKFVQFIYEPWYLNDTDANRKLKSDPKKVCSANGIKPNFSNINLDGGNVVRESNKVVLTDRIFEENESYDEIELIDELSHLLDCGVIIIPQHEDDITGHADGMVRWMNDATILSNEISGEKSSWIKGFKKSLDDAKLVKIEIPAFVEKNENKESAIGIYINFLHIGKLILLPEFDTKSNRDSECFELMSDIYSDCTIEQVCINEIAKWGGLLNCICWNIYI